MNNKIWVEIFSVFVVVSIALSIFALNVDIIDYAVLFIGCAILFEISVNNFERKANKEKQKGKE